MIFFAVWLIEEKKIFWSDQNNQKIDDNCALMMVSGLVESWIRQFFLACYCSRANNASRLTIHNLIKNLKVEQAEIENIIVINLNGNNNTKGITNWQ